MVFAPCTSEFVNRVPIATTIGATRSASLDMSCEVLASPATVNFRPVLLLGGGGYTDPPQCPPRHPRRHLIAGRRKRKIVGRGLWVRLNTHNDPQTHVC